MTVECHPEERSASAATKDLLFRVFSHRPSPTPHQRRVLMRRILLAMTVVAAAACNTLGKQAFREPVVTLADVKVTGVGLTGGSLDVVLNVENPNDFRLDATQMHYN